MKQTLFDGPVLARKYDPPCQEMPNVVYNYGIDKHEKHFEETIVLYVSFPEIWKIITQNQGVDVHALIGNIGGYIGLFLGKIFELEFSQVIRFSIRFNYYQLRF